MTAARQHPHSAQESVPSAQKEVGSMSESQTLEARWRDVSLALTSEELDKAVRALLLVGLEEAVSDGRAGLGSSKLRRRIEELGR